MDEPGRSEISIIVDNEEKAYTPFSPEPDLNYHLKAYIKSKTAGIDYHNKLALTVISEAPLDEERFRTAVSNWISV